MGVPMAIVSSLWWLGYAGARAMLSRSDTAVSSCRREKSRTPETPPE